MTVAMAAILVAALVIPDGWRQGSETVDAPLTLALAYLVVRALHLGLYLYAAADDPLWRRQVLRFSIPTTLAWAPLIVGAVLGGWAQTALWTVAFVIDYGGGRIAAGFSQWEIYSPVHFAERHGLVVIIALGESLISVGAGAGSAVNLGPGQGRGPAGIHYSGMPVGRHPATAARKPVPAGAGRTRRGRRPSRRTRPLRAAEPPPQMVMVLAHRSWVDETGGASLADVDGSWYGLSPALRLTRDLAPVGTPGCCL